MLSIRMFSSIIVAFDNIRINEKSTLNSNSLTEKRTADRTIQQLQLHANLASIFDITPI